MVLATKLGRSLGVFFREGVRVTLAHPGQAWQFVRMVRHQVVAAKVRRARLDQGLGVPPIIIFSITHQCNLQSAREGFGATVQFEAPELDASQGRRAGHRVAGPRSRQCCGPVSSTTKV